MLPPEAIEEFKELYFEEYKVLLSDEGATKCANNLVRLYCLVYGDENDINSLLYPKPKV
jgi:hypothetical protein